MKAVPQIINNECGDGDCGADGWRAAGAHGLVRFVGKGAGREGIREAQGGFSYVCVFGVCSVGAGLEMGVWVLWQRPQWASLGSHMKRHGKRSHAYDLAPRACQTLQTLQRRLGTPAVQ